MFEAVDIDKPIRLVAMLKKIPKKETAATSGMCSRWSLTDPPVHFTHIKSSNEDTGIRIPLKTKTLMVSGVSPITFFTATVPRPHNKQVVIIAKSANPKAIFSLRFFIFPYLGNHYSGDYNRKAGNLNRQYLFMPYERRKDQSKNRCQIMVNSCSGRADTRD